VVGVRLASLTPSGMSHLPNSSSATIRTNDRLSVSQRTIAIGKRAMGRCHLQRVRGRALPSELELEHAQKRVQLFQTAVSDRKTLRGLTQFVRRVSTPPSVSRSIKNSFRNRTT
jgi:hypothetical protein